MPSLIGKRMVGYPPRPTPDAAGAPTLPSASGGVGLPKVGSILTMSTGLWNNPHGGFNPRFQWYSGASSILNATNQSFSIQSADNYFLTCRLTMGNGKWGSAWRDVATGTIMP